MAQMMGDHFEKKGVGFARELRNFSLKKKKPGDDLLSQPLARLVPSAQEGLTAVFGMGTGVSPPPSVTWNLYNLS